MSKVQKSDYEVLPRNQCKKPRAGSTAFKILVEIENLGGICMADQVALQHEGVALDYLQRNRLIVRMLRHELDALFPFVLKKHRERIEALPITKQRIIVSANCWHVLKSSAISEKEVIRKIDDVIENLVNAHMWEYDGLFNRIRVNPDMFKNL